MATVLFDIDTLQNSIIDINIFRNVREPLKYYFADFVLKGGGGHPPNP